MKGFLKQYTDRGVRPRTVAGAELFSCRICADDVSVPTSNSARSLNAFNNINFIMGSAQNDTNTVNNFNSQSFDQVTNAYQDTSTTYDPDGRLIQWVLRINF
jgi:hypothetical protein